MAEEIAVENGQISNYEGLVTFTYPCIKFDYSSHTAYRRASLIDLYLHAKFHLNQRNFLWTYGRTYACTHVRTFETGLNY